MIEFSIPDFWHQSEFISTFFHIFEEHPECFNDDIVINSVFGSFPCIWDGGRAAYGEYGYNWAKNVIEFFNNYQIQIRHTFTNRCLNEYDLYDRRCNQICELSEEIGEEHHIQNACTIYDEKLAEYISNKYPRLQIIYSTTKELKTVKEINSYSQKNLIIPSYTINHNINLLKQLQHPENIELLCIETGCMQNCPNRIIHQDEVSESIITFGKVHRNAEADDCPRKTGNLNWYKTYNNPNVYISIDQIRQVYLPLGFNKFKISGRGKAVGYMLNNLESYIHYFVKPDSQNYIRLEFLTAFLNNKDISTIGKCYN